MKNILMVIPFVFLLGACTNVNSVPKSQHQMVQLADVTSNDYVLTNMYQGQGLTLGFDNAGRVFGYSGLNRFFGKADVRNGHLKIEQLASTKMGGPHEAMIREAQYMSMLGNMTNIEVKNEKLILSNDAGEILIFEPKK